MSLGGDDRLNGAQANDATPRTAKIIPLRTMPDESSAALDDPPVIFASEEAPPPAQTRIAEQQPVEPSLPEQAKPPGPGSTVVIEQPVPAPPLTGGDRDGG